MRPNCNEIYFMALAAACFSCGHSRILSIASNSMAQRLTRRYPCVSSHALGGFVLKSSAVSIHDQSEKVHVPLCLALQFDACSVKARRVPLSWLRTLLRTEEHYVRVAEGATKNDPFEFEWPVSGGGGPRDRVQATAVASNFQLALACVRAKSWRWHLMSCEPEPWLIAVSLCGCFCAQCLQRACLRKLRPLSLCTGVPLLFYEECGIPVARS